jgi:hypothetical protein
MTRSLGFFTKDATEFAENARFDHVIFTERDRRKVPTLTKTVKNTMQLKEVMYCPPPVSATGAVGEYFLTTSRMVWHCARCHSSDYFDGPHFRNKKARGMLRGEKVLATFKEK